MSTLGDFVAPVAYNLGNRTDLTSGAPSKVAVWLQQAYQHVTMSYPFEELQFTFDDTFLQGIDTYDYPADARAIVTLSLTFPGTLQAQQPIYRRDIRLVRRYANAIQGPPSIYAPFNRKILVRPVPDRTYPFKWDFWQLPQITANITDTIVLTPGDWDEIIQYIATMYGHMSLMERDKANDLHTLLYGDPKNQEQPGIIKTRLLIHAAESYDSEYSIRARIRRYSHVR